MSAIKKLFKLIKETEEGKQIIKAQTLWDALTDVPTNIDAKIQEEFLHFKIGTSKYDIWNWFEEQFNLSVQDDLLSNSNIAIPFNESFDYCSVNDSDLDKFQDLFDTTTELTVFADNVNKMKSWSEAMLNHFYSQG